MLLKYRPAIDALGAGIARALVVKFDLNPWLPLYEALGLKRLGQADVVLELLRLTLVPEAEALIGHPIIRLPARTIKPLPEMPKREVTSWDRVVVTVAPNPRLPSTDSFQRYKEFKPGVSLATALRRGATHRDIREALNNGWITCR